MDLYRTPADCFAGLPDWPFRPHYVTVGADHDLGIAYVDEGPADADPVLLLHGEPTWSYLYRRVIPPLVAAGHRIVAPDLPGFGRSDKPVRPDDVTYEALVGWMEEWLVAVDLRSTTLFCQDWGGLVGLRLVARHPDRFERLIVSNTALPDGLHPMGSAFAAWQEYSASTPSLEIGNIVDLGSVRALSPAEIAAYDAPFPEEAAKVSPRRLPSLVPTARDHPSAGRTKPHGRCSRPGQSRCWSPSATPTPSLPAATPSSAGAYRARPQSSQSPCRGVTSFRRTPRSR